MIKNLAIILIFILSIASVVGISYTVEKNSTQDVWNQSDVVQFNITINNTGTMNLTQVNITDTYMTSLFTYHNASITPNDTTDGSLKWSLDMMLIPNATLKFTIELYAILHGNNTNFVGVRAFNGTTALNQTANSTVEILYLDYNLSVTKSASSSALVGDVVTFTINVSNSGNLNASNLTLIDEFNASYYSYDSASGNVNASNSSNGVLEWNLNMSADSSVLYTVNLTAILAGNGTNEIFLENDTATLTQGSANVTLITPYVNLSVVKTVLEPTIFNGSIARFLINITNTGNSEATGINVTDTFNQSILNYTSSTLVPDMTTASNVTWMVNVSTYLEIYINFSTLITGRTLNSVELRNDTQIAFSFDFVNITVQPTSTNESSYSISLDTKERMDSVKHNLSRLELSWLGSGLVGGVSYDQHLMLGNSSVSYGKPGDVEIPTLYLDVGESGLTDVVYELKVSFGASFNVTEHAGEEMLIAGKNLSFSSNIAELDIDDFYMYDGADKWRLQDGQDLELNGDDVDGVVIDTINDSTGVLSFSFIVSPGDNDLEWGNGDDIDYIPEDMYYNDEVFDFHLNFTGETTGNVSPVILYRSQSDRITLNFTNENLTDISMDLLNQGTDDQLNVSWGTRSIMMSSGTLEDGDYCILSEAKATWGITHIIRLTAVDDDSHDIEFTLVGEGSKTVDYSETTLDGTINLYGMTVAFDSVDEALETIDIDCYDMIYTKGGMRIDINEHFGSNTSLALFNITEDYFSNGQNGTIWNITAVWDDIDNEIDLELGMTTIAKDDDDNDYQYSDYGTYLSTDVFYDDAITMLYPNTDSAHRFHFASGSGVDRIAPSTTVNYRFTSWRANSSLNISRDCDDPGYDGCNMTYYCVDSSNTCTPTNNYVSINHSVQGTTYLRYRSIDNSGNTESINSQIIKLDSYGPTTTDNVGTWALNVTMNLTASDNLSGIDYTTFNVSGVWYNDTNFTFTTSGNYTVYYYSVDLAGNSESVNSVDVLVDNTAPAAPINQSMPDFINTAFNFSWGASVDGHSGIASYLIQTSINANFANETNYTSLVNYKEISLAEGKHYTRVFGIDNVGLNSSWLYENITVDMTAPVIDSTASGSFTHNETHYNFSVNWNVTESYFDTLLYSLDSNVWQIGAQNSSMMLNLSAGYHTFRLRANDSATNEFEKLVEFVLNVPMNVTDVMDDIKDMMNDTVVIEDVELVVHDNSSVNLSNGTHYINDTLNMSIIMENITVRLNNFDGLDVAWNASPIINLSIEPTLNNTIADLGSSPQVMVTVENTTSFITGQYDGEMVFNTSGFNFSYVYYCNGTCQKLSVCGSAPCYTNTSDILQVFVPAFSTVVISLDDIIGTVNITSPLNDSNGGDLTFDFVTTEDVRIMNCTLNGTQMSFPSTTGKTFSVDVLGNLSDDVLANGNYMISLYLNDTAGNTDWTNYTFSVSDTTGPDFNITPTDSSYSSTSKTVIKVMSIISDEYANYTYFYNGIEYNTSTDLGSDKVGSISIKLYRMTNNLTLNLTDRHGNSNVVTKLITLTKKEESSSEESTDSTSEQALINLETKFSKSWSSVAGGEEVAFEVNNDYIPIRSILFKLKDQASGVSLTVVALSNKPSNVDSLDDLYSYMNVYTGGVISTNVDFAKFSFRVPKTWLDDQGLSKDSISLYRFNDGWQELVTDAVVETDLYHYYEASSEGFSYFAIASGSTVPEATIPDTVNNPPNMTVVVPEVSDLAGISGNETETTREPEEDDSLIKIILIVILLSALISGLIIYMRNKYRETLIGDRTLGKPKKSSSIYSIRLKYYIMKSRKLGKSDKQIKKELIDTGWPEETIKKYIK